MNRAAALRKQFSQSTIQSKESLDSYRSGRTPDDSNAPSDSGAVSSPGIKFTGNKYSAEGKRAAPIEQLPSLGAGGSGSSGSGGGLGGIGGSSSSMAGGSSSRPNEGTHNSILEGSGHSSRSYRSFI